MVVRFLKLINSFFILSLLLTLSCNNSENLIKTREKVSINEGWAFFKYPTMQQADSLIYDERPEIETFNDSKDADSKPTKAIELAVSKMVLKPYILPTANEFITDSKKHYKRPEGNPGNDFPYIQASFDDSDWNKINLPHDWGISEEFQTGWDSEVGGGMGRLASHGVAWYRKKINIPAEDKGKSIFLEFEGVMSYAMVWLNGNLVGGWPYGYNSWHLDISKYIKYGEDNQLSIRVDNPPKSARWYPGGGIYRNVWLVKTNATHVSYFGTNITTKEVSNESAVIDIETSVNNDFKQNINVEVATDIYFINEKGEKGNTLVASVPNIDLNLKAETKSKVSGSIKLNNPKLWGPYPSQTPNLYVAVSKIYQDGELVDSYETRFGIRDIKFDSNKGVVINGEVIKIKGVNQHHDLGALGAAFNYRAAERQLEILRELGCNAIRLAHNPPAPELLELTDKMGFLVVDEIFDVWERKKTPYDFHLIFPEWYEADTRSFIRRDRNCPSIIMWSIGNEVGEQYTAEEGAKIGAKLCEIVKEEDSTRPTTASMNFAKPDMPFSEFMDVISLNYQGEGIRDAEAYKGMKGIHTTPLYPAFHKKYPDKVIVSSETASALSTRGTYLFPVYHGNSAPSLDGSGGDPENMYVSAYELYTAPFGSSADKVFASQDKHPYVAGEFVWSGWDYLGEPTPYYLSRSSYSGIIDLAGFKKDRFFIYQARWRPELPLAHILPHWNWPQRIGQITPVHVFTTGDEAELFLNGKSLGRKIKGEYEYRLRWDSVVYEPGILKVIVYKEGKVWVENEVKTTGDASKLSAEADRNIISADGKDLSFITITILDKDGNVVPMSDNLISFTVEGPAEIAATDNGNPYDLNSFKSKDRKAFNGLALVILKSKKGEKGKVILKATSEGISGCEIEVETE